VLQSLLALVLLLAVAPQGPFPVEKVIDGDTIAIRRGGQRVLVRLIGVDAPEVAGPHRRAERGGGESRRELERLLVGRRVTLQADPRQPERDRHGRVLAHVYAGDTFVNAEMIRRGYARAYRKFRHTHRDAFIRYEKEARAAKRGLWRYDAL
jgi:micrococcal nuclease